MNKTQRVIAAQMLEMASEEFSNHGCNDFELDNTPENLEFIKEMIAASDYPDDEPHIYKDKIITQDLFVMDYCAKLLRGEI